MKWGVGQIPVYPEALYADGYVFDPPNASMDALLNGGPAAYLECIETDGAGTWLAGGDRGSFTSPAYLVRSTDDGVTWSVVATAPAMRTIYRLHRFNGLWIAFGDTNFVNTSCIWYSSDGLTWTKSNDFVTSGTGMALWVAADNGSRIVACGALLLESTDGMTWTAHNNPDGTGFTISKVRSLCQDGGHWVWIPTLSSQNKWHSTDGINYTLTATTPVGTTWASAGGGKFLASSGQGTYQSPTGVTWTLLGNTDVDVLGNVAWATYTDGHHWQVLSPNRGTWYTTDLGVTWRGTGHRPPANGTPTPVDIVGSPTRTVIICYDKGINRGRPLPIDARFDYFNRGDDALVLGTGDDGYPWDAITPGFGSAGIQTMHAYSPAGTSRRIFTRDCDAADGVLIVYKFATGDADLVWRLVDANNYYYVNASLVARVVGGVATTIGNLGSSSSLGSTIRIELSGSTFRFYRNQSLFLTITGQTTFQTATKHGMSFNSTTARLDDWYFIPA